MKNIKYLILIVLTSLIACSNSREYDEKKLLAYGDQTGKLWICNEDGSEKRVLGTFSGCFNVYEVSFSSDGGKISFLEENSTLGFVFTVVDLNGQVLYRAGDFSEFERPRWNINLSYLMFKGNGGIWPNNTFLLSWPDGAVTDLAPDVSMNISYYTFISSDTVLAVVNLPLYDNKIVKINLTTNIVEQQWDIGTLSQCITVSPDLKSLAFLDASGEIKILDLATGIIRSIVDLPVTPEYLSWSVDGSTIVYTKYGNSNIFFVNVLSGIVTGVIDTGVPLTSVCYQYKPI